jgi:hypothetical protein
MLAAALVSLLALRHGIITTPLLLGVFGAILAAAHTSAVYVRLPYENKTPIYGCCRSG